jgi:hypothetical protein
MAWPDPVALARVLDVFGLKADMQSRPLSATADIEQPCRNDGSCPKTDIPSAAQHDI